MKQTRKLIASTLSVVSLWWSMAPGIAANMQAAADEQTSTVETSTAPAGSTNLLVPPTVPVAPTESDTFTSGNLTSSLPDAFGMSGSNLIAMAPSTISGLPNMDSDAPGTEAFGDTADNTDLTVEEIQAAGKTLSDYQATLIAAVQPTTIGDVATAGTRIVPEGTQISQAGGDMEGVTRQILQKEIDLIKLSTNFRRNNPRLTGLRKYTDALLRFSAYSTANAGNIVTFINAFKYHGHIPNFRPGVAQTGPFLIFLGELFFFSDALIITAIDLNHSHVLKTKGFDRDTFETKANGLEKEIKALLSTRAQLANSSGDPLAMKEQAILQDISDNASKEFVMNYSRAAKLSAFHFTDDAMVAYTSATGAWFGGLLIYLASKHSNPRLTGPAGIGFILSGVGFCTDQLFARMISQHVQKTTRARLLTERGLHDTSKKFYDDKVALAAVPTSEIPSGSGLAQREHAYELLGKCFSTQQAATAQEEKEMWHKYLHDEFIFCVEGGGNIAAGTILSQAGFAFNRGHSIFDTLDKSDIFLKRFGAAAVVFTPPASGGMVDTPAEVLYSEYRKRKDTDKGLSDTPVFNSRMKMLEEASAAIH